MNIPRRHGDTYTATKKEFSPSKVHRHRHRCRINTEQEHKVPQLDNRIACNAAQKAKKWKLSSTYNIIIQIDNQVAEEKDHATTESFYQASRHCLWIPKICFMFVRLLNIIRRIIDLNLFS